MQRVKGAIVDNDILKTLRIKSFFLMMISELFSQLAFNMLNFTLIFMAYILTRSNTAVSGIILSFTIPAILLSVVSGVYVDRWSKKKVLFYTNLLRTFLLLPFLFPNLHLGLVYTFTFLIAVSTQFFIPAEASIIPLLVPKKLILPATSIFSIGIFGTIFAGYIFAGPLLLLLGRTSTFILLAVLFLIGSVLILFIKPSSYKKDEEENFIEENEKLSFASETKELFSFIKETKKVMHALLVITIAQAIIFMFVVLGPGYLATVLRIEIENVSLILIAPAAVGVGIGALFLGSIGKKFKFRHLSSLGFLLSGVVFMLFPLVGNKVATSQFIKAANVFIPPFLQINTLHMVIFLAAIVGFAFSFIYISCNTTIQLETNQGIRGRIFGFLNALIGAVSFLPVVLAGTLADLLGVSVVIVAVGVVMLVLSLIFFIFD